MKGEHILLAGVILIVGFLVINQMKKGIPLSLGLSTSTPSTSTGPGMQSTAPTDTFGRVLATATSLFNAAGSIAQGVQRTA